ncbi:MAG: V-type ATPase subunit [Coriobacteriia bacterium]
MPLFKSLSESVRYGFAVGKVRVLETRVFGAATYERLVDAPTFEEQRRILSDTPYGSFLEGAATADDVETALEGALDEIYRFLVTSSLPEPVVRFFRVRYDYANLRAVLKARLLGASSDDLLVDLGTVDLETITGPSAGLPDHLRPLAEEFSRDTSDDVAPVTPEDIDTAVERALFADIRATAKTSGSRFLRDLAALEIDVTNAKTAIRARRRSLPLGDLTGLLLKGGTLKVKAIEDVYALPFEQFAETVARAPRLKGVAAEDLADPARLDVVTDNLGVRFLRTGRVVPVGPEPVIAYVIAREAEVRAVRTVLIGKLAGLGPDALRARLREVYV